jgi:hypothetical protein
MDLVMPSIIDALIVIVDEPCTLEQEEDCLIITTPIVEDFHPDETSFLEIYCNMLVPSVSHFLQAVARIDFDTRFYGLEVYRRKVDEERKDLLCRMYFEVLE